MYRLLLFAFFLLTIAACRRKPETYTVTGQLLEDCTGTPMAGQRLRVSVNYRYRLLGKTPDDNPSAGTGTTDAEGRFSFTFEAVPGWDEMWIIDEPRRRFVIEETLQTPPRRAAERNLAYGTLYRSLVRVGMLRVAVQRPVSMGDTLYYGEGAAPEVLYPIADSTLTIVRVPRASPNALVPAGADPDTLRFFWGIGRAAYDSARAHRRIVARPGELMQQVFVPMADCTAGAAWGTITVE